MRNKGLDFIRGLAVLLVIARHSDTENIIRKFGWLGVDLFFVLSGFLVSGLLFTEYANKGRIDIKRFLIRRAFKILPPFYFYIIVSVFLYYFFEGHFQPFRNILYELLLVQSYLYGIAPHTWSLAIEEQFYLVLAFTFLVLSNCKLVRKTVLINVFITGLLVLCFLLRYYYSYKHRTENFFSFHYTHLRMDGIVVGVLISYLYHFTVFYKKIAANLSSLSLLALFLLLPGFIFNGGSFFMNTIGLSMVNAGFGILCLFFFEYSKHKPTASIKIFLPFFRATGYIGIHSYSIYLWHLAAKDIANSFHLTRLISTVIYVLLALTAGIAASLLIEKPLLKIRDSLPSLKYKKAS
jgi:peptidoglycan/LPS O-acetylase OafA/YrhL